MSVIDQPDLLPHEGTYCPDQEAVFQAFMSLMPPGTAWDNVERSSNRDTVIRQFISGMATSWLHFEDDMCAALDEWFCATALDDLDVWALDYGLPDDCDIYNASLCAKVAATGPPTEEFLLQLLAANGYSAEGRWLAGKDPEFPGVRSTFWAVVDPYTSPAFKLTTILRFRLGTGHRLGAPSLEGLQCMLERYVPAHCAVDLEIAGTFRPTDLGAKLQYWISADDTANGAVASWADRIAPSAAATQATGTRQPVSALDGSGFRFVGFDGVDDYLRTPTFTKLPHGNDDSQIFALFKQRSQTGDPHVIVQQGDNSDSRRLATRLVGAQQQLGVGAHAATNLDELVDENPAHAITGTVVAGGDYGPADQLAGRAFGSDTVPERQDLTVPLNTPNSRYVTIGADGAATPAAYAPIDLRHLMFTADLTPHEAVQLEGWLAWDINRPDILDGNHSFRNVRP